MRLFSDLPRNARYSLMVEPMWALFGGMMLFYAPLYMREIGLSKIEIGIVSTVNMMIAFGAHFFAAPITNKLGRKRTILTFDIIAWTIPMFIWSIAQNFWFFIAAASLNAFVKICSIAWSCLVAEDTSTDKRSRIFAIVYLISYASGIFTPITGFLTAKYGTAPTMRVVYILGMLCMTSMFFIRNYLVRETSAGLEMMKRYKSLSIKEAIVKYIQVVAGILKNKNVILISIVFVISNFVIAMNYFQSLYMNEYLEIDTMKMAITQGINAVINILLYLIVIPRLAKYQEGKILTAAFIVSCAGAILFLFVPAGNFFILIIAAAVVGIGGFSTQAYRDSILMNALGEHEKADVLGAVQTTTALVCIPSGYIAGLAYSSNPKLLYILIAFLFALAFCVASRIKS